MIEEIRKHNVKVVVRCDFCGRKVKPEKYRCEECGEITKTLPLSRTKVWDTRNLFPHLCNNCCEKLDRSLQFMQDGLVKREEIMKRNAEINRIRKERLMSKG